MQTTDTDQTTTETPKPVKRIEILRKNATTPEVYYAETINTYYDRAAISLYGPLHPRPGFMRYIDISDVIDMFVSEVPQSEVPEVDAPDQSQEG